jgi:transposase InsO family protein
VKGVDGHRLHHERPWEAEVEAHLHALKPPGRANDLNRPWKTADQVEIATLHYVDWFNNQRLYEENGDLPPVELEQAYYRQRRPSV